MSEIQRCGIAVKHINSGLPEPKLPADCAFSIQFRYFVFKSQSQMAYEFVDSEEEYIQTSMRKTYCRALIKLQVETVPLMKGILLPLLERDPRMALSQGHAALKLRTQLA